MYFCLLVQNVSSFTRLNVTSFTSLNVFSVTRLNVSSLTRLRSHNTLSSITKICLKNMAVLLYTYFYNISLNVLRLTFFNIYNLPFYALQISVKLGSKLGQKLITFPIFWAPAPAELQFSIIFCRQPRDRQNRVRDFLCSKYFFNNLRLTVFVQNTLSKLVELFQ